MEYKNLVSNILTTNIPEGRYLGVCGGYKVSFEVDGQKYEGKMKMGVRTPRMSCFVNVKKEEIFVEYN